MATINKNARRTCLPITDVKLIVMIDAEMDDMLEVLGRRLRLSKSSLARMALCRLNEDSLTKETLDEILAPSREHAKARPLGMRASPLRDSENAPGSAEERIRDAEERIYGKDAPEMRRKNTLEDAQKRAKWMQTYTRALSRCLRDAEDEADADEIEEFFTSIADNYHGKY